MIRSARLPGRIFCLASIAALALLGTQAWPQDFDTDSGSSQMIGQAAPEWSTQGWVNADKLEMKQLRGKVVLLRFLNDTAASAVALNDLYQGYRARGLAVIGMYAPEPFPTEVSLDHVRELASSQGFEFPIGLDSRWETLNRYWLQRADAELTAATFLIDRKGVIRYIQPDGLYQKNSDKRSIRNEYVKLEKEIQTLLKADTVTAGGR